jgi:hypothetical protein
MRAIRLHAILVLVLLSSCSRNTTEVRISQVSYRVYSSQYYTPISADISYTVSDTGVALVDSVGLPWEHSFSAVSGTYLYLSARRKPPRAGNLYLTIYRNGREFRRTVGVDPYTATTLYAILP